MTPITARELAARCAGTLHAVPTALVTGFATDSREVGNGDLFIAIGGANVNGIDFVPDAFRAGAALALTESTVPFPHILVDSIQHSLARFGGSFRAQFTGPVVGVTGSAGKTTTKELAAAALSPLGEVLKSKGNRNTEFTSPLMWAELTRSTQAVVVEMAMRGMGQIAHLAAISLPTIGIVTNIGISHLSQVGSREGIASAKSELLKALPSDGTAILWQEDEFLDLLKDAAASRPVRTFGFSKQADCVVLSYKPVGWDCCKVEGTCLGQYWSADLPSIGRHIALDAAAALLAAVLCGVPLNDAASALGSAQLPPMRMEIRRQRGVTVLLDTYNASPASMLAAIETLTEAQPHLRKSAILGEMLELGSLTEKAHRSIGEAVAASTIAQVRFFGESMKFAEQALNDPARGKWVPVLEDLKDFVNDLGDQDVLLVKGSRALGLERVLEP